MIGKTCNSVSTSSHDAHSRFVRDLPRDPFQFRVTFLASGWIGDLQA